MIDCTIYGLQARRVDLRYEKFHSQIAIHILYYYKIYTDIITHWDNNYPAVLMAQCGIRELRVNLVLCTTVRSMTMGR